MMPVQTAIEFALLACYAHILIVSGRFNIVIYKVTSKVISTNTASTENSLYIFAEGNFSTGEMGISNAVALYRRKLTEFNREVGIVTLSPDALQGNLIGIIITGISLGIGGHIKTSLYMPMIVYFSRGFETEQELILAGIITIFHSSARESITSLTVPLNHVSIAFEVGNANTEVIEFSSELSSQFVNESLVSTAGVLSHSLSYHLSHFVTGDVTVALEGAVAITIDYAVSSQLAYCVISPMVSRNIGERVASSKSRASCANYECRSQSGYECLFHKKLLLH